MYALIGERRPSSLVCKQADETNSSGCTACENLDAHWRPALRSSHSCWCSSSLTFRSWSGTT